MENKRLSPEWFKSEAKKDKYNKIDSETKKCYEEFQNKYSLEEIKSLNEIDFLEKFKNLCYELERKYTDFGDIRGGSAGKFDVYFSEENNSWRNSKNKNISQEEAVKLGKQIKEELITSISIIKKYGEINKYEDYIEINKQLHNNNINTNKIWILKYYHMMFPEYFPTFYNDAWHINIFANIGLDYNKDDNKFLRIGRINYFVQRCGISNITFAKIIDDNIGKPKDFYRIGTGDNNFDDWKNNSYIAIGWNELGNLEELLKYSGKNYIKNNLKQSLQKLNYYDNKQKLTKKNNEIYDFCTLKNKNSCIVAMNGQKILGIGILKGDYYFNDENNKLGKYAHCRKVEWIQLYEQELKLKIENEGKLTTFCKLKKTENIYGLYNNLNNRIENNEYNNKQGETSDMSKNDNVNKPLNQILYGPPGTGKTYSTKKLVDIIIKNNTENLDIIDVLKNLKWFEVIVISIFCNNNKLVSIQDLMNMKYINIYHSQTNTQNLKSTLLATLQDHGDIDCDNIGYDISKRHDPFIFYKNENSMWNLTNNGFNYVKQNLQETINALNKKSEFITFHQSYSYEEFIEGIKPVINNDSKEIKYEIKKGIFKDLCIKANSDPKNNYVLIIDEINRGNISKIFGELITLIEEDKRIGNPHELKLTLPYSQEEFGIPKNLYIIGTMNTSDRSIASVDIALRRRFKFIEMMPKSDLVTDIKINDKYNFKNIFEALNEKITVLLDRDHQIGHGYFMKDKINDDIYKLRDVWFDEILPLLNEYFYNDWEKLQALLGEAIDKNNSFIVTNKTNLPFYNYDIEDKIYNFAKKEDMKEENFKLALSKIIEATKKKENNNETLETK